MERHKCKLCFRTFANGRALGGHMKAHLAILPPKPHFRSLISFSSYSSPSSEEATTGQTQRDSDEKSQIYGLRENPKKCFRLADPEFDTGSVVLVQDRESETESKNPITRRRSKRAQRKRPKLSLMESPVSSVSDTSPEEDVAMCLMMLSRDNRWTANTLNNNNNHDVDVLQEGSERSLEIKFKRLRGKHHCHSCAKSFRSSRALASHRTICQGSSNHTKIFECPFCSKVFGSGQALGGHKRSHLMPSYSSTSNHSTRFKDTFIDLNLPAPAEDDHLSVVSDA